MKKSVMLWLTFWLAQASYCQRTIPQKLDELMQAYCQVNKFNGSVLVAQKGKILLEKGYGIKCDATNTLNDKNSLFQIYSITKPFTSTLILQLVEQKRLSLTDKLSKFYPDYPKGDSITIEHLLTHTSGLYEYTRGNTMADQSEQAFIQFIQTKPLDFSPGSSWSYSNSGYWMLGFIIQKITGMNYGEAVRQLIFKPLQMNHSGLGFKELTDSNKTTGYAVFTAHTKIPSIVYPAPGPFAAGAIYATARDLYRFHEGLQRAAIIHDSSLQKAYTTYKNKYGYGWIIGDFEGKRTIGHSGGAAGFRSNLLRIPEDDVCIVLLNNHENASMGLITNNLLRILYNKPYKLPAEKKLPDSVLTKHAGTFSIPPSFNLYIELIDGRLMVRTAGQPPTALMAEKEHRFFSEEANCMVEFAKDSLGRYNELTLHPVQGGELKTARRIFPVWGMAGTATPKGWDEKKPDIPFTEDTAHNGLWRADNVVLQKGLMVFRYNNDWGYHYGDDGMNDTLELNGPDIKVEAGTYDIVLDLTHPFVPVYKMYRK